MPTPAVASAPASDDPMVNLQIPQSQVPLFRQFMARVLANQNTFEELTPQIVHEVLALRELVQELVTSRDQLVEANAALSRDVEELLVRHTGDRNPHSPRIPKPSLFENKKDDRVDDWIFRLEQFLDLSRIHSDPERIATAAAYLGKDGLSWYRNNRASLSSCTWSEFKARFLSYFAPISESEVATGKLHAIRQGKRSASAFVAEFQQLRLRASHVTESTARELFVAGLNPELVLEIKRDPDWNTRSLDKLIVIADRMDRLLHPRRTQDSSVAVSTPAHGRSQSSSPSSTPSRPLSPTMQMEVDAVTAKLTVGERSKLISERRCFNCKQTGHSSIRCPEIVARVKAKKQAK